MRLNIDHDRLDDRRQLLSQLDGIKRNVDTTGALDGMDHIQSQAFDIILRGAADALDLSRESDKTIAPDATGAVTKLITESEPIKRLMG